jgi:hypothetical protein
VQRPHDRGEHIQYSQSPSRVSDGRESVQVHHNLEVVDDWRIRASNGVREGCDGTVLSESPFFFSVLFVAFI